LSAAGPATWILHVRSATPWTVLSADLGVEVLWG